MVTDPSALDPAAASLELDALFHDLRATGRNDAAYCVAHAGAFLLGEGASPDVRDFAARYRPLRPRRAARALDSATWLTELYHPDDDPYVGKLFESVLAPVRRVRTQPVQKFGLLPREAHNPASSSIAVVRALGGAAFALGVPAPLIFLRTERAGGLEHLASEPIASVAGVDVASGRTLEELSFLAGHHMAYYRADHYVRALYATVPELTSLLLAALKVGQRDLAVPPSIEAIVAKLELLVGEDAAGAAQVRRVAKLFVGRSDTVDVGRWVLGVERTALRAGLLLCGDLAAAKRALALLPNAPADAMADLAAFAMSEPYFALRQLTGIALWPDAPVAAAPEAPPAPVRPTTGTVPPPPMAQAVAPILPALGDLRSVEISLDELEALAPRDTTGWRSVEIPLYELEGTVRVEAPPPTTDEHTRVSPAGGVPFDHPVGALVHEHLTRGESDRAYYASAVWSRRAGPDTPLAVRDLIASHRARATASPSGSLAEGEWLDGLADPGERTAVGRLLAALAAPLRAAQPRAPEDYGFDRAQSLPETAPVARALAQAARAFGVAAPLVFAVQDYPLPFARPPCDPAVTLVNLARLEGVGELELRFLAAEHVAYFRPERHARVLARSPAVLTALLEAIREGFARGSAPAVDEPFVAAVLGALGRDPAAVAVARDLSQHVAAHGAIDEQVIAWCEAAERTAARAGLLLAFDFDAATRALSRQRGAPALVVANAKLAALEEFALSDAFAVLRRRLGF